ncbi:MAG: hypothetical protein WD397_14805 [Wenzhouxiangellaceae bacterium]
MSRTVMFLMLCGIVVLGAATAYWTRGAPEQRTSMTRQTEIDEAASAADRPETLARRFGDNPAGNRTSGSTELAESVQPNVVTYKQGKPLWELPYEELHKHVDDLRALVDAGWGRAVLPLTRLVSDCLTRRPSSEREIRETARSRRARWQENRLDWSNDKVQRQLEQVDQWLESRLQESSRRRAACGAVTATDEDRIMDWLELALEQRHPEFLTGYLQWDLLPDNFAWVVRHAERLAAFNRRFEVVYLDAVYAGERELLDMAWRLYASYKVLAEPNPFIAAAFDHAADLDARARTGVTRQYPEIFRQQRINIEPSMVDDARAEGRRIYDRCCAGARMPR